MLRSNPSMPAATTAADPAAARSGRGVRIARRAGFVAVVGWAAVSTSILAFDRMGPGAQAAAQPDMALFERQMTELSAERDARAAEAAAAQTRFTAALSQLSLIHI